jgi:hypothetical protein
MKNNCLFLLSLILLIAASCGEKQKDDVIDMKDITPHSNRTYDSTEKEKVETIDFGFDQTVADSIGLKVMEIDSVKEPFFVDRFSPRSQTKLQLQLKEGQLLYCQWTFKDSVKTKNALYNWIDCYGEKCKSIHFGQKVNFQKDNFRLFMNDTSITYISSSLKLSTEDWQAYLKSVNGVEEWNLIIEQATRGKAKWMCFFDDKLEELIPQK